MRAREIGYTGVTQLPIVENVRPIRILPASRSATGAVPWGETPTVWTRSCLDLLSSCTRGIRTSGGPMPSCHQSAFESPRRPAQPRWQAGRTTGEKSLFGAIAETVRPGLNTSRRLMAVNIAVDAGS